MNVITDLFTTYSNNNVGLKGLTDESFCLYINKVFQEQNKSIIILTPTIYEANKLLNSLSSYTNDVLFFPMDDFLTSMAVATSPDLQVTRLETINELLKNKKKILVTHLMGYLRYLPTKETYQNSIIELKVGQEYGIKELTKALYNIGYNKETIVSKTTDMAIRGFIVDIFPIGENHPIRIEYFGDEIDSIRYFDEDTQKSIENIKSITIHPATEFIVDTKVDTKIKSNTNLTSDASETNPTPDTHNLNQKYLPQYVSQINTIKDYLGDHLLVIKDYAHLKNLYQDIINQTIEYRGEKDQDFKGDYMCDLETLKNPNTIYYLAQDNLLADIKLDDTIDFKIKSVPEFHENIDAINKYLHDNYAKTIVICLKKYQIKNFSRHINVPYVITNLANIIKNTVNLVAFDMNSGFNYQETIFITDKELFNISATKKTYKTKFKYSTKIKDVNKLELGDYIVHSVNGIGVYNGIKTLDQQGLKKDYVELLYKDNDKLYIPVEKIDVISKFSGKEGVVPKVNSLGSSEWHKTKMRVTDKVRNIAKEYELLNYDKKDSFDVCFIKGSFRDYISDMVKDLPGNVIDIKTGKLIGKHNGLSKYTIGQRKGLDIGGNKDKMFVVGKDLENNILYIAFGEDNEYLLSDRCIVKNVNFNSELRPNKCSCKFRYRQADIDVELEYLDDNKVYVKYDKVKSVTPGQTCVFYIDDLCIGGGTIDKIYKDQEELWYL